MKFLANENYPVPSVKILREAGIAVKSIMEEAAGISDEHVIRIAQQGKLIILTFDKDYGELNFRHGINNPPAVVFFRYKGLSPEFAGNLLKMSILDNEIELDDAFTVIEENNIRQRKY